MGCSTGILTGSLPGVHPNTVFALLMVYSSSSEKMMFFSIGLGITHSLINHGPSIFIGIPDESSPLISLPGKKLVSQGEGPKAFFKTYYGSISGVLITCISFPLLNIFYRNFLELISGLQGFLIFFILLYIVLSSKNVLHALITVLLGSFVGFLVFNINSIGGSEGFLPLFTGLFGTPVLVKKFGNSFPDQTMFRGSPDRKNIKGGFKGFLAGIFSSVLPGVGPSSTATVLNTEDRIEFLSALGSVNTTNIMTSILIFNIALTSRTGLADYLLSNYRPSSLYLMDIVAIGFISSGITFLLSRKIVLFFISLLENINEKSIKLIIICFLLFLIFINTGHTGVGIYFISTGIGIITSRLDSKKSLLMSCIIIPVLFL